MRSLNSVKEDSTKKCKNFGYTFSAIFFLIFVVLTTFEFFLVGEMAKNYAESELAIDEEK